MSYDPDWREKATNKVIDERNTYRELCGELIQTLRHIYGAALDIDVGRATIALRANKAFTKAEKILGEKNGTSN